MPQKDDLNMVPEWAVDQVMENERTIPGLLAKREEFSMYEPEAAEWLDLLINSDIEKAEQAFPEVFSAQPKLNKTFYFMLWKSYLRGWTMGEAKWKSTVLALPGEDTDKNPNHYTPDPKDFL